MAYYDLDRSAFPDTKSTLRAIFAEAIHQRKAATDIFGLRLQGKSRAFFLQQLRSLYPTAGDDLARLKATFGEVCFVYLNRRNKLEQAISIVKAEQTGLWHRNADGTELERLTPPADPVYDPIAIARYMAELEEGDAAWRDWFAAQQITPHIIHYEQLENDPIGALTDVLYLLGIDPARGAEFTPATDKLADSTNREWARRFLADHPTH